MNCLAHAFRYLEDPYFAAGCCLPDWLGMIDRKVRIRRREIEDAVANPAMDSIAKSIVGGVQRHLADDQVFHHSVAFASISSELARIVRLEVPTASPHLPGFVGHIMVELLLDAAIENHRPGILDAYYRAMESISHELFAARVNAIASRPTEHLPNFMQRYLSDRFLFDYLTDDGLLKRLNRVLGRVRLDPLPSSFINVIASARTMVMDRYDPLMECVAD
jgi:hypothetical protein